MLLNVAIRGSSLGVPIRVEKARNPLGVNVTETGSMRQLSRGLEVNFGK